MDVMGEDIGGADLTLVSSAVFRLRTFDDEVPLCYVTRQCLVVHADVVIFLEHERAHSERIVHRELPPRYLRHKIRHYIYLSFGGSFSLIRNQIGYIYLFLPPKINGCVMIYLYRNGDAVHSINILFTLM